MPFTLKSPVVVGSAAVLIALLAALAIWWAISDRQQVLFDKLLPEQINSISAELDRAGIKYEVDRDAAAISVAATEARNARLAVMASGNAMRELVGLELFDKSDFGMTDFAQKINYQRAMEGEIARTISGLAEVKHARVHLVLPEHGLFHNEKQKPRASITVFLNEGAGLSGEQVQSIQRIAMSAIPDLLAQDVTVVNQSGKTLSATNTSDDATGISSARLEQKKAVEAYTADKVRQVLEKAVGVGRFAVSVDIALDMNQKTTKTERILEGTTDGAGVKRLRTTTQTHGDTADEDASKEVEYELGRESQQIVHGVGEITQIHVGVILDSDIQGIDAARVRDLVLVAAGANPARGDKVTVVQNSVAVQRAMSQVLAPSTEIVSIPGTVQPSENRFLMLALFLFGCAGGATVQRTYQIRQQKARKQKDVEQLRLELRRWVEGAPMEPRS